MASRAETRLRLALDGSWRFALADDVALTFDVSARTLVAHEASGFSERGIAAALMVAKPPRAARCTGVLQSKSLPPSTAPIATGC